MIKSALMGLAIFFLPNIGLAATATLTCSFPTYHSPDDTNLQSTDGFVLKFRFDTITRDAFLEGNNGLASVVMMNGESGLSFLEILLTGAVQSTTVANSGAAVHSRHSIIGGDLVPSQYYGECE